MSNVVIVNGGTSGLGLEVAQSLLSEGYQVIVTGLMDAAFDQASMILAKYTNCSLKALDITKDQEVQAFAQEVEATYGSIYALVNNAAIGPLGTILTTDAQTWTNIMSVNLTGPFLMCKHFLPLLMKNGGSIVNIGSGAGWGKPNMAAYATSKGGLVAFTTALALDHFYDKVRVNMVIPGGGGIHAGMSLGRVNGDTSKLTANAIGSVAGRPIDGYDMAEAVKFLISDKAQTISGTIIDVGCFFHQGSSTPFRSK
ncbi:TPA: SDR family oxidoreductase [Acinetobacter baumannii]|nr:SDR family oxidoreductase [Acinetobacter baumannii]